MMISRTWYKILANFAESRLPFFKTDFHWNDPGSFPVAQEIISLASEAEGKSSVWRHKLEITKKEFSGGIANFMPLFKVPTEEGLFVKVNWENPKDPTVVSKQGIFATVTSTSQSSEIPRLGRTVIVGDSFSDAMTRTGINIYFTDVYRARWEHVPKMSDLVKEIPPGTKHFIIQFVETQLKALYIFADKEDIATATAILNARNPN